MLILTTLSSYSQVAEVTIFGVVVAIVGTIQPGRAKRGQIWPPLQTHTRAKSSSNYCIISVLRCGLPYPVVGEVMTLDIKPVFGKDTVKPLNWYRDPFMVGIHGEYVILVAEGRDPKIGPIDARVIRQ